MLAIMNAHYELAALLLDKGADPNAAAQGWTALHQIAWTRRPNYGYNLPGPVPTGSARQPRSASGSCVQHGADVNARETKEPRDGNRNMLNRIGATPFLLAAKAVDLPLMRALLEQGADPKLGERGRHHAADGGGRRRHLGAGGESRAPRRRRSPRSSCCSR